MHRKSPLMALFLAVVLIASACGRSDGDITEVVSEGGDAQSQPADDASEGPFPVEPDGGIGDGAGPIPFEDNEDLPEGPIPVEPDGGIGDGAEPLPGYEEPEDEGTWHGAEVAVTNCPGMEWTRVQASAFTFSVPADYLAEDVQGVDSEVGVWSGGNNITIDYDYGWYSGSRASSPGAENEVVDFSGIVGERTVVRDGDAKFVSILFPEVEYDGNGQWNRLGMTISFDDINDEIIGRCIVRSIEWGL